MGNMLKKIWVYIMLGLGFMAILKKVLLACHTNIVALNGLTHFFQKKIDEKMVEIELF